MTVMIAPLLSEEGIKRLDIACGGRVAPGRAQRSRSHWACRVTLAGPGALDSWAMWGVEGRVPGRSALASRVWCTRRCQGRRRRSRGRVRLGLDDHCANQARSQRHGCSVTALGVCRAFRLALAGLRNHDPGDPLGDNAHPGEDQDDHENAKDNRVDPQVAGQTAANPGQDLVLPASTELARWTDQRG
jgi:hypothetical protein